MILYARLILDSLFFLGSLEDINQELSTLPNGLDQAYAIFCHDFSGVNPLKWPDTVAYWNISTKILRKKQENKQKGIWPG